MLMFCNICTCINISMKKVSFCRELTHVHVRAEAKRLLSVSKRVLLAGHLAGAPSSCRRITSAGLQTKGPAPRPPFFDKGHHDHSDRSSVRVGNGSPRVLKEEWQGFLLHKSQVTNTNGQEVNFICLVCRGSPYWAVFSTSCRSQVLSGIARPRGGWKGERERAWNLGGPLIFIGIKKAVQYPGQACIYVYT